MFWNLRDSSHHFTHISNHILTVGISTKAGNVPQKGGQSTTHKQICTIPASKKKTTHSDVTERHDLSKTTRGRLYKNLMAGQSVFTFLCCVACVSAASERKRPLSLSGLKLWRARANRPITGQSRFVRVTLSYRSRRVHLISLFGLSESGTCLQRENFGEDQRVEQVRTWTFSSWRLSISFGSSDFLSFEVLDWVFLLV